MMFSLRAVVCCVVMHVTVLATSDEQCGNKSTSLSYNVVSEYNATGHWVAKVSGHRVSATPGPELCPWGIDVGHQVSECGETSAVRIAANIQIDSGVPYDQEMATDERDEDVKVPPNHGEYEVIGGSAYKLMLKLRKWEVAQSMCREDNANLLVINSQQEADTIAKILEKYPNISDDPYENKQIWVGLHDQNKEGDFVSVYNEPLSEVGYSYWAPGEPNDLGMGEDCVSVLRNGRLNDEICAKKLAFICERYV